MAPRPEKLTGPELGKLFGVTAETVRLWRKKGMPTRLEGGRPLFIVSEVLPWRREEDRREAREHTSPDEAKERARLVKAQASLAELKLRKESGELIASADVEAMLARVLAMCRARILSIRGKWAPRVIGLATMAEATTVLDEIANDILASLREGADELEDDTDPEAAA